MDKMWTDAAWEAFLDFQNDKKFLKKLNDLLKDIDRNGYSGLGKPEPLKDYLVFRHVFRHSYGYELDWLRLNPLFSGMADVWQKVKETWKNFFLLCDILHLHQSRIIYIMFSCSTMTEFLFIRSKTRYFHVLFFRDDFSSGETSDSNFLKT